MSTTIVRPDQMRRAEWALSDLRSVHAELGRLVDETRRRFCSNARQPTREAASLLLDMHVAIDRLHHELQRIRYGA